MRAEVWRARSESPLFNCRTYAEGLEDLYGLMWARYASGEKPAHIAASSNQQPATK